MRIRAIRAEGYGRLSECSLEFAPGVQVVVGPNERGKSTVRGFITEMLYGQKRESVQVAYEESNALRLPWDRPECYGGAMVYELDNGTCIEVRRTFHRGRELVHVHDLGQDRDITSSFPALPNRELDFGRLHVGVSKSVFINAATIGHFSLDGLGDHDALEAIRDRLLAIADSGSGTRSAETALRELSARIEAIGRPDARNHPLPAAQARLNLLAEEIADAVVVRREQAMVDRQRTALKIRITQLEADRAVAETNAACARAHRMASRLQEAERIQHRINEITQRCFQLGPHRDVPTDRISEAQHSRMLVETARLQVERREQESAELSSKIEAEQKGYEGVGIFPVSVPEQTERRYHEFCGMEARLQERLEEAEAKLRQVEEQIAAMQRKLAELPDFGREASDPAEWLSQLANSFTLAVRAREEHRKMLERLREEVTQRKHELEEDSELFHDCESFSEQLRDFEITRRRTEEKRVETESQLHTMKGMQDELKERMPGLIWLSALCSAFLLLLVAVFVMSGKAAVLFAAGIILLAAFYFVYHFLNARSRLAAMGEQVVVVQGSLDALNIADSSLSPVELLLKRADCRTLRELEGRYDRYREALAQLTACLRDLEREETAAQENDERVTQLYARLGTTFQRLGETVRNEDDVQNAAGRIISRHQDYRELKRRMADLRNTLQSSIERRRELLEALETTREGLGQVEEAIRGIMRESGFVEASGMTDTMAAMRAYGEYVNHQQARLGKLELLRDQLEAARSQLVDEKAHELSLRSRFEEMLATVGVDSVEQWQERIEKAREYRSLQETRETLEERLSSLLEGASINDLRRAAAEASGEPPSLSLETLDAERDRLTEEISGLRAEQHALELASAEKSAGSRSLNEIEEERAALELSTRLLQEEVEAAAHAFSIIEEVAALRHARIAPVIARDASECFAHVTGGAHAGLTLGSDFRITLSGAGSAVASSERSLSKGALDQVYLSLRIALVKFLSRDGESVPMLLDDPFANYDDQRLRAALELLREIGARHQILLFTCREDMAQAAQSIGAPILSL